MLLPDWMLNRDFEYSSELKHMASSEIKLTDEQLTGSNIAAEAMKSNLIERDALQIL